MGVVEAWGDEKRGTEVESAGSRSVGGAGRDGARALESTGRSVAVGAEHALGAEAAGAAAAGGRWRDRAPAAGSAIKPADRGSGAGAGDGRGPETIRGLRADAGRGTAGRLGLAALPRFLSETHALPGAAAGNSFRPTASRSCRQQSPYPSPQPPLEEEVSIWLNTGTFYFALTGNSGHEEGGRRNSRARKRDIGQFRQETALSASYSSLPGPDHRYFGVGPSVT